MIITHKLMQQSEHGLHLMGFPREPLIPVNYSRYRHHVTSSDPITTILIPSFFQQLGAGTLHGRTAQETHLFVWGRCCCCRLFVGGFRLGDVVKWSACDLKSCGFCLSMSSVLLTEQNPISFVCHARFALFFLFLLFF